MSVEWKTEKRSKIQMEQYTLNMVPSKELWLSFLRFRENRKCTVNWRDSESKLAVPDTGRCKY